MMPASNAICISVAPAQLVNPHRLLEAFGYELTANKP